MAEEPLLPAETVEKLESQGILPRLRNVVSVLEDRRIDLPIGEIPGYLGDMEALKDVWEEIRTNVGTAPLMAPFFDADARMAQAMLDVLAVADDTLASSEMFLRAIAPQDGLA